MSEEKPESNNDEERPMLSSDAIVNKESHWNLHLAIAASAAVFGSSFQFGYNTGVINAPAATIKEFYNETYFNRHSTSMDSFHLTFLWGFTVSIFAVGGMIGSFCCGYITDKVGRKNTMLLNNIPAIIAAILMGSCKLCNSYEVLIFGRFVIGVNCGINTGVAPLYLTEIAPTKLRGQLGTLNQMGIVSAILLSQVLGLNHVLGSSSTWPILLAFTAIFSIYQLLVLPFCPESPKYLVKIQNYHKAGESLQWLRQSNNVQTELENDKKIEECNSVQSVKISITEIFKTSKLCKPMIIAIVMQLSQQFSGITAVFYYSTSLFTSAGLSKENAGYGTVGMGLMNVFMTAISLVLIERAGRRLLHLIGLGGMFICSVLLTIFLAQVTAGTTSWASIASIVAVILYVAAFQTGPGAIPWFITAELFKPDARSSAISVAGLVNWSGNFIVGIAYPPLEKLIHGYTFLIFAVLLAIFWIFTFFKVPETKGKNIEEITAKFE